MELSAAPAAASAPGLTTRLPRGQVAPKRERRGAVRRRAWPARRVRACRDPLIRTAPCHLRDVAERARFAILFRVFSLKTFRVVALTEATSFLLLLVASVLKRTADAEIGVTILGPIHGALFVAYVLIALNLQGRAAAGRPKKPVSSCSAPWSRSAATWSTAGWRAGSFTSGVSPWPPSNLGPCPRSGESRTAVGSGSPSPSASCCSLALLTAGCGSTRAATRARRRGARRRVERAARADRRARRAGARPRRAVRGQPRRRAGRVPGVRAADAAALAGPLARLPARPHRGRAPGLRARAGRPIREIAPDGSVRAAGHRDRYVVVALRGVRGGGARPGRHRRPRPARAGARRSSARSAPGRSRPPARSRWPATASAGRSSSRRSDRRRRARLRRRHVQPPRRCSTRSATRWRRTSGCASPAARPSSARPATCRATPSTRGSSSAGRRSTWPSPPRRSGLRFGPLAFGVGLLLTTLALILQSARRARRRLAIRDARLAEAFEASPIGQALAFRDGHFARVNPRLRDHRAQREELCSARRSISSIPPTASARRSSSPARSPSPAPRSAARCGCSPPRARALGADALHPPRRRGAGQPAADPGHRRLRAARAGGRAAPPGRARRAHRAAQPPRLPAPARRADRSRARPAR